MNYRKHFWFLFLFDKHCSLYWHCWL